MNDVFLLYLKRNYLDISGGKMTTNTTNIIEPEELHLLREDFLKPDELFLLEFMNSFNRKANKEWSQKGLWEAATSSYYY